MMTINAREIIERAIDEVNEDLEVDVQISKNLDSTLLGSDSNVDSLTLVRLLITIERIIDESVGRSMTIVDESAFEEGGSPFSTINSLIDHVNKFLLSA